MVVYRGNGAISGLDRSTLALMQNKNASKLLKYHWFDQQCDQFSVCYKNKES